MKAMILGWALPLTVLANPAAAPAERWSNPGFEAAANVTVHRGGPDWNGHRDRDRRDRFDGGVVLVDREWQGDTAWRSGSYNDWWHDRPNRSFPRWTTNNGRCLRMWWGGEGWRC